MNDTSISLIQNFWWFWVSHVPLRCRLTLQQTAREGRSWSTSLFRGPLKHNADPVIYLPKSRYIRYWLPLRSYPPSFLPSSNQSWWLLARASSRVGVFNRGVVWSLWFRVQCFVFLALATLYPNDRLSGIAMATKTCRAAKLYQRPLNLMRSLSVLSSESEYFER